MTNLEHTLNSLIKQTLDRQVLERELTLYLLRELVPQADSLVSNAIDAILRDSLELGSVEATIRDLMTTVRAEVNPVPMGGPCPRFPVEIRQLWNGQRVQAWIDRNLGPQLNRLRMEAEEAECAHMSLNDYKAPSVDEQGQPYSLVGRIWWTVENERIKTRIACTDTPQPEPIPVTKPDPADSWKSRDRDIDSW